MLELVSDAERLSRAIDGAVERIGTAVGRTVESRAGDWIAQEPQFTDRLLARIEDAVNHFGSDSIRWRARTLTDRGPGAEEARVGADFLGVFEATTSGLSVAKGFLSQAKLLREGDPLGPSEHNRLRQQCRRMLERTPDSFVFLYGESGVRVISALAVLGSAQRHLDELGSKSVEEFFYDHFCCFIGDASLTGPGTLLKAHFFAPMAVSFFDVRRALYIEAVQVG